MSFNGYFRIFCKLFVVLIQEIIDPPPKKKNTKHDTFNLLTFLVYTRIDIFALKIT